MYSNCDHNYFSLESVTFIYVFHDKDKFTNFRRVIRGQELLYNTEVILIESWGEILLPLRMRNQISILILKEITYVPNFLLNLVFLASLKNEEYRWHHWSSKIHNKNISRIIGSNFRQGNNYKISNFENIIGTTLLTLAIKP